MMSCSPSEMVSPRIWTVSLAIWSSLTSWSAFFLPVPTNELTISQPVKACKLGRTWHTLWPSFSQSHLMLIKCDLLLVPLIKIISAEMAAWWWLASTSTSVSDENTAMLWCRSTEAWKAWRNILVSASSWVLWRSTASVVVILPSKALLSLVHLFPWVMYNTRFPIFWA